MRVTSKIEPSDLSEIFSGLTWHIFGESLFNKMQAIAYQLNRIWLKDCLGAFINAFRGLSTKTPGLTKPRVFVFLILIRS